MKLPLNMSTKVCLTGNANVLKLTDMLPLSNFNNHTQRLLGETHV